LVCCLAEVLHCAFAHASFEARHDSRDEDGGVAGSPDETKNFCFAI
jgi:hypothetical protein